MASSSSFTLNLKPLQPTQLHLSSFSHCKNSSTPIYLSLSPTKPTITLEANARAAAHSATEHLCSENEVRTSLVADFRSGFSSFGDASERAVEKSFERKRVILKDRHAKRGLDSVRRRNGEKMSNLNGKNGVEMEKRIKKKAKVDPAGLAVRVGLDMCSKRGDVFGAIKLYDLARQEGVKIGQYHYAVLLYLCSSAATGVVHPAKSGNSNRSSSEMAKIEPVMDHTEKIELDIDGVSEDLSDSSKGSSDGFPQTLDGLVEDMKRAVERSNGRDDGNKGYGIKVSEEMKRFALKKGFEIYNKMRLEKVAMNEATFTSVARMAMALGDGEMAFDVVKEMKEYGVNPRLRSYGPALAIFSSNGDVESAFKVEQHMLENGVYPEETELASLLRVSIETGKSDKVYYVLHKLRTSVRQVSPITADLIEKWFQSKTASRVGKRKWDRGLIIRAMENGGGGWHGKGWLGKGKWTICRTTIGSNGVCKSCGEKLVTIDLDPVETENFAKSVASIAAEREKNSSFQKFQKWLDYYGPFEAVVDAANIGLYSQRKFKPSKVNAVVNGIRQMLPSKKWPLVVLHNRRISGEKMDEPFNRAIIDKWKNADALYATPTGSNDDWYWLYAAIKFKCLLVTNDEMRDHLFQLLGNDFFPKWKERHQVRFSFTETGPTFRMPPPCSVVIQESEDGQWHVPIASELNNEDERTWLCCYRGNSSYPSQDSSDELKETANVAIRNKEETRKEVVEELCSNAKYEIKTHASILPHIEAAEKNGAFLIDFQI